MEIVSRSDMAREICSERNDQMPQAKPLFCMFWYIQLLLTTCTSHLYIPGSQQYKERRHIFSIKRCASLQMHVWRRCEACQLGCVHVYFVSFSRRAPKTYARLREQASCARTCFRRVQWELCRGRGASTSREGLQSPR